MTRIRLYRDGDRGQLRELAVLNYRTLFPSTDSRESAAALNHYVDHILSLSEKGTGQILVAEEAGRLVGFVCLQGPVLAGTLDNSGHESHGFMSDLFVAEDCRQRGIGALLLERVETLAEGQRIGKLVLRVAAGNEMARRFYHRRHYREEFLVMSKPLVRRTPAG
jgi:ribosomal protein S18 acetylase RimI-like enzyme